MKKRGNEKYIAAAIVIVSLMAIIVFSVNLSADAENARKITATMREYVLIMESQGCLTAQQQQELILKLEKIGMTNIVFNVNPLQKVNYGSEVTLSITGTVNVSNIVAYQDFELIREAGGIKVTKTLSSTAQY